MKRSKWCKYCDASKQSPVCSGIMNYDRCIRKFTGMKDDFAEQQIQSYRDRLAKLVRETRYIEDNGFIECARMLDPEKSARVAARVQEIKAWRIKAWREQHG